MSDIKNTDEPTVKDVQEETSNPEQTDKPEETVKQKEEDKPKEAETTEKPLGELLQNEQEKESVKKEVDFKDLYKKERKEKRKLESDIKKLQEDIESGDSLDDIQSDIDSIADKYNVNKDFLKDLQKSLAAKYEEQVNSTLKPIQEKEKAERFDTAFNGYFDKAIEKMPEMEGIVSRDAIKSLAQLPQNSNKTLTQLIEDTYGNSIEGKRTIESSKVRGTTEPTEVDFNKAKTDTEYFKQVMANPELKKKYNAELAQRTLR